MTKTACRNCGGTRFEKLLDFGPMPIAHRFIKDPGGSELMHPFVVHLCAACALIQILDPISREELYRDYNFCFSAWKPQPHMKDEVARIAETVGANDLVVEIGSNDGAYLNELKLGGLKNLAGVEPNRTANVEARKTGAPIFEDFFSDAIADQIKAKLGPASLVASRQAFEHIPDLHGVFAAVRRALAPGGWLMLEVPDFEIPMKFGDISSLWEEHVNYFTEATFCDLLEREGFGDIEVFRYDFCAGALGVLAKLGGKKNPSRAAGIEATRALGREFVVQAGRFRERLVDRLKANRAAGRANAFYGTGCRTNMLVNAWKLAPHLDLLVDDQKEKQGLFLPGTSLRVSPSSALYSSVGDCFLSVNSENEDKVVSRHPDYEKRGGRFLSVNCPSPRLKDLDVAPLVS